MESVRRSGIELSERINTMVENQNNNKNVVVNKEELLYLRENIAQDVQNNINGFKVNIKLMVEEMIVKLTNEMKDIVKNSKHNLPSDLNDTLRADNENSNDRVADYVQQFNLYKEKVVNIFARLNREIGEVKNLSLIHI